tara:strand:- start:1147 stop:1323 length:177 start_codon:yes stop_codon:yes gene_type:complete
MFIKKLKNMTISSLEPQALSDSLRKLVLPVIDFSPGQKSHKIGFARDSDKTLPPQGLM